MGIYEIKREMASWLYFSLVLKVIFGSPNLEIEFERTGVKILWLNSFNFDCTGTQCNVVNLEFKVTDIETEPLFEYKFHRDIAIARDSFAEFDPNNSPLCNGTYMHQCEKGGAINSQTCVEYCRHPIKMIENGYSQVLQIQNYFAMKDDGQYTCKIHYDEEVREVNKTLKFIQPHCNGACQFGLVYSVLGTFVITLVLMISIALPHTPNKVHAAT